MRLPTLTLCALAALTPFTAGCSWFRSEPGGVLTATSTDGMKSFAPAFITAAYTSSDADTADFYFSDLPRERFTNMSDALNGCAGSILHLHVFLVPESGQTPVNSTACNLTLRHLVLTGSGTSPAAAPTMGLYSGGGFLLPHGDFGAGSVSGSINAASHRLTRSSPNFVDLLGSGSISGQFSAPQDEQLAQQMGAKFEALVQCLPALPSTDADLNPAPAKPANQPKGRGGRSPAKGGG